MLEGFVPPLDAVPAVALEQGLQELLDLGKYDNAADQIRKSATTKELAEEYQRTRDVRNDKLVAGGRSRAVERLAGEDVAVDVDI